MGYTLSLFFLLANMWQAMISACCVAFRVYLVYGPPQNSVVDTWPPPPLYVNPLARLSPYASGIAVHFALSDCQEGQSGGTWRRPLGVGRVGGERENQVDLKREQRTRPEGSAFEFNEHHKP